MELMALDIFAGNPRPDALQQASMFALASRRASGGNMSVAQESVSFFIIEGLSNLGDKRPILFVLFLLAYIVILGGNTLIILLVWTDARLCSPMYFFLHNLSFVDMLYTSVTIPGMLAGFLADVQTISVPGCFAQMYLFIHLAVTGRCLLTAMAYDRYVAICQPLRYGAVMTRATLLLLVAGAWLYGAVFSLGVAAMSWLRPYCGPNVVQHGWCDPASVRRLACADTRVDNALALAAALLALVSTGVLILASYALIARAVARMGAARRLKALGTCAAHLTVVCLSYGSASFVYISYRVGNFTPEVRIIVAVLYAALTPFLNPLIYSLRNRELREAFRRMLFRFRGSGVSPRKPVDGGDGGGHVTRVT